MARARRAPSVFVTLGTQAGGVPFPDRSQPANLLLSGGHAILIDAGGGVVQQLAKAGVPLANVDALFISHLHFDHTGGLFALLGLRYQVRGPKPLTIYGPPGTKTLVDGLLVAMRPASEFMSRLMPNAEVAEPSDDVRVIEVDHGDSLRLGDIVVRAVANTHYGFPEGSPELVRFLSLTYRFDLPDRSILFTGDTGPSPAVDALAAGADLLVSEVIDVDATIAIIHQARPDLPEAAMDERAAHFRHDHLTPDQVGAMAAGARVKKVVLTHLALGPTEADRDQALALVGSKYKGKVVIANDLYRF